ncbi:MAG: alpha/beta hydrolase [Nitrospirota bacterium]
MKNRRAQRGARSDAALLMVVASTLAVFLGACDNLFYHPSRTMFIDPVSIGFSYEEAHFTSLDGTRLHGWFFPADFPEGHEAAATVIHFHGNAENISTHFQAAAWLVREGFNVFIFDYRGYGQSSGQPDTDAIQSDATAAVRWVRARPGVDPDRLVFFGQSLGVAIAVHAARHERAGLRALVLESGFAGYRRIAREKLASSWITWPLQWPLSFLVSDRYRPIDDIARIGRVPVLLIHGTADPVVPYHHAEALFAAANEPKLLWTISGGGHTSAFVRHGDEYRPRLVAFLNEHLADAALESAHAPR